MITLRPITRHNIQIAFRLKVRDDQSGYVADNIQSIAQAYVWPTSRPELIYAEEVPVGFVLSAIDPEVTGRGWIIRFMIDQAHQGKGYGRHALRAARQSLVARGATEVRLSYVPQNTAARRLYAEEGFQETGEVDEGEIVAAWAPDPDTHPATPDRPVVTVESVGAANRGAFDNLFVFYFNELAGFDPGLSINAYGLPVWKDFTGPTPTTVTECVGFNWWIRGECDLHLFRIHGAPAGFAVTLHQAARLPQGIAHEVVDFYILPKFRGRRFGRAAARLILNKPGAWLLYTLSANRTAHLFWRDTLHQIAGSYREVKPGEEFRFAIPPATTA